MPKVNVCLSPDLLHLYSLEDTIVVVTDVFRATSCMVTALAHGVAAMLPVATVEECRQLQTAGYLAAAEREAKKVDGFELDNSPYSYMEPALKGTKIAMTTTNGTKCIALTAPYAAEVLVGGFLNLAAVVAYLRGKEADVLLVAAGWKSAPSLEDTLFCGAVVAALDTHSIGEDTAVMARTLYETAKKDLMGFLGEASHIKRLANVGVAKDIGFCLTHDLYDVVPRLFGQELRAS
jgi:2-phosphosulfolactate phosphatase